MAAAAAAEKARRHPRRSLSMFVSSTSSHLGSAPRPTLRTYRSFSIATVYVELLRVLNLYLLLLIYLLATIITKKLPRPSRCTLLNSMRHTMLCSASSHFPPSSFFFLLPSSAARKIEIESVFGFFSSQSLPNSLSVLKMPQ